MKMVRKQHYGNLLDRVAAQTLSHDIAQQLTGSGRCEKPRSMFSHEGEKIGSTRDKIASVI